MISKSRLKYIQSLGQKKQRDEHGVFIAEGPKVIKELLQSNNAEFIHVYALSEWTQQNKSLLQDIDITIIDEEDLEKMSQLKTANQVIAVVKKFAAEEPVSEGKISVVLDTIQDPGNLGTIIRIADWFAISQIVCSHDCADVYNPKVVQATMGSIARVKLFYTDLSEWFKQQIKIRVYASMLEGKDVTKMSKLTEGLILIGNESKGIREELLPYANERITIPGKGKAESLNAAVAVGIILSNLA